MILPFEIFFCPPEKYISQILFFNMHAFVYINIHTYGMVFPAWMHCLGQEGLLGVLWEDSWASLYTETYHSSVVGPVVHLMANWETMRPPHLNVTQLFLLMHMVTFLLPHPFWLSALLLSGLSVSPSVTPSNWHSFPCRPVFCPSYLITLPNPPHADSSVTADCIVILRNWRWILKRSV